MEKIFTKYNNVNNSNLELINNNYSNYLITNNKSPLVNHYIQQYIY
jgi:hypothetical protein